MQKFNFIRKILRMAILFAMIIAGCFMLSLVGMALFNWYLLQDLLSALAEAEKHFSGQIPYEALSFNAQHQMSFHDSLESLRDYAKNTQSWLWVLLKSLALCALLFVALLGFRKKLKPLA